MRARIFVALFIAAALHGFSQTSAPAAPALPKDPRAILDAAAPFYDFSDPALKPWHLKASYQLYDYKGKPTEQGTFEYWWAAPKVYRVSWSRPGASWTDWHTPDGKHLYLATGERPKIVEGDIESALFSPLPNQAALNPDKTRLELQERPSKGVKFPCVALLPAKQNQNRDLPPGYDPTYCFDPQLPVLRVRYTMGTLTMEFNNIAKYQGKYLARGILLFDGDQKVLSASTDSVSGLSASDPALTPAPDASAYKIESVRMMSKDAESRILKKQQPIYPVMAKQLRQQGTVMMEGTIGIDGRVQDLDVLIAPSPILADAAKDAVSHWEYRPYLVNGNPVELETTFNVIFVLGR